MENSMDKYLGTYLDDRYEILETIAAAEWLLSIKLCAIGCTGMSQLRF